MVQPWSQTSDSEEDSVEESLGPRWTSRDVYVDGHDIVDASQRGVVPTKNTATDAAGTNRDDESRFRHGLVGLHESQLHIPCDGPGDQEHICMARRCHKLNAKAFQVVDRIVQGNDFEFATIA